MDRLAGRIMLLHGRRRALLAFAAGLVATLGLAPVNVPAVGFLSFPVLVWLLDGASGRPGAGLFRRVAPAFRIGWCFGFGYFLGGLWWLGAAVLQGGTAFLWALPLAVLGLPMVLAIYHGLAAAVARLAWSDGPGRLFALAASFAGFEWLRGTLLTGFTWNELGVLAAPVPLLMGSLSLIGLHGLTILAVFVFSLPALLAGAPRGRALTAAFGVAIVAAHAGYGAWHLSQAPVGTVPDVALRIVQPAILQSDKWDPAEADANFAKLLSLTSGGEPAAENTRRLVVWPESAFPFILTDRPDAVTRLADALAPTDTLMAGATRVEGETSDPGARFYNSLYVIDSSGAVRDAGDKLHLVPFGEYLPFQEALESLGITQLTMLPGGFSAGSSRRVMRAGEGGPSFLPLICYEAIFPDEILGSGESRPDFLLNVTNDAWYGHTPGPYQHLKQAQLTAAAFGLPLVRAANTGISVVTDSVGRPVAGLSLGEGGTVDAALPVAGPPTVYSRIGNLAFAVIVSLFALLGIAASVRSGRV
ncbi:apolipoprotein N-acyltransferase [Aureimonas sp. Leaf324]|uniref:apolipoprotein N-acyltransferase n=1 Tax=Aureimonas sp. Leaf324 TaxID=1736336 RepID=UPI0009E8D326|nr:apolipoprotein N-acyltransferase [Aureimonas sp. Leaf324]